MSTSSTGASFEQIVFGLRPSVENTWTSQRERTVSTPTISTGYAQWFFLHLHTGNDRRFRDMFCFCVALCRPLCKVLEKSHNGDFRDF